MAVKPYLAVFVAVRLSDNCNNELNVYFILKRKALYRFYSNKKHFQALSS